ncbi:hypothetical protein MRX96_055833 [Rhipicephalus microplus]
MLPKFARSHGMRSVAAHDCETSRGPEPHFSQVQDLRYGIPREPTHGTPRVCGQPPRRARYPNHAGRDRATLAALAEATTDTT